MSSTRLTVIKDPSLLRPSRSRVRSTDDSETAVDCYTVESRLSARDAKCGHTSVVVADHSPQKDVGGNNTEHNISWAAEVLEPPVHRRARAQTDDDDEITVAYGDQSPNATHRLQRASTARSLTQGISVGRIASSMFVIGDTPESRSRSRSRVTSKSRGTSKDSFQATATLDWDALGGVEYRSLKLLLKIIIGKKTLLLCDRCLC